MLFLYAYGLCVGRGLNLAAVVVVVSCGRLLCDTWLAAKVTP